MSLFLFGLFNFSPFSPLPTTPSLSSPPSEPIDSPPPTALLLLPASFFRVIKEERNLRNQKDFPLLYPKRKRQKKEAFLESPSSPVSSSSSMVGRLAVLSLLSQTIKVIAFHSLAGRGKRTLFLFPRSLKLNSSFFLQLPRTSKGRRTCVGGRIALIVDTSTPDIRDVAREAPSELEPSHPHASRFREPLLLLLLFLFPLLR